MSHKYMAIGYPRVSSYHQNTDGSSLDGQTKAIEEFCERNEILLVAHFREIESAATASKRPAFKAALRYVTENKGVDLIVFANLDRFARNIIDNELIRQTLRRKGKRIISTQQSYLTPLEGGFDDEEMEAAIQHAAVDNERERKKIKRRFLSGKQRKVDRGGWHGHRPPYEYDVVQGELVLNKERARVLRAIRRMDKWTEMSGREICEWLDGKNKLLNNDGTRGRVFEPPSARRRQKKRFTPYMYQCGISWNINSVNRMRRQMRYGLRVWRTALASLPDVS